MTFPSWALFDPKRMLVGSASKVKPGHSAKKLLIGIIAAPGTIGQKGKLPSAFIRYIVGFTLQQILSGSNMTDETANDSQPLLCSNCFADEGLRIDAAKTRP